MLLLKAKVIIMVQRRIWNNLEEILLQDCKTAAQHLQFRSALFKKKFLTALLQRCFDSACTKNLISASHLKNLS